MLVSKLWSWGHLALQEAYLWPLDTNSGPLDTNIKPPYAHFSLPPAYFRPLDVQQGPLNVSLGALQAQLDPLVTWHLWMAP